MTTWTPLADPETARRCWAAIDAIAGDLKELSTAPLSSSLSGGTAGLALFFAYLAAARDEDAARDGDGDRALDLLGSAIDALGESVLPPSLYGGFLGIGWTVEHLTRRFFEAEDDLCSALDEGLRELISTPGARFNSELISGLSGFGVYLLERLPNPEAARLLGLLLDRLEETAEESKESDGGITWHTLPEWVPGWQRDDMPDGCYNLGVAHGVPGVLGFLAAAHRAGVEDPRRAGAGDPRIRRLAEGIVRWLLGQRLGDGAGFPASVVPGQASRPTRTAWCYGDPGIAAVLLSAARSFRRADWEAEAVHLARLAARRSEQEAQTNDAGLCHGTAGLAHLFNRMHQATGDPELGDAAAAWYRRTLDHRRPGEGVGGYLSFQPMSKPGEEAWVSDPGVLVGAAGVGLALLAAVSEVEPSWDRMLLSDIPPSPSPSPKDGTK